MKPVTLHYCSLALLGAPWVGQCLVVCKGRKRFDGLSVRHSGRHLGPGRNADGLFRPPRESSSQGQRDRGDPRAAAAENREQLKQRVDKAQGEANQAMGDAEHKLRRPPISPSKWVQ